MTGQSSPVSSLVAFTDDLRAVKARLAELERLASKVAAPSGVYALNGSSVPHGASTDVPLVAVSDPLGWLSGGGNVVPTIAGMYRVSFAVEWPTAAYTITFARIRLNGSGTGRPSSYVPNVPANPNSNVIVAFIQCNGTTDSIDTVVFQDSGVSRTPNSSLVGVELLPGH